MATDRLRETLVGAAAIGALVLLLVASQRSAQLGEMGDGSYRLTATFNRVDGVNIGDAVQLAGVPVGTVESSALDENYRAALTLHIDGGIELPSDTSAAVHTEGLFGGKFIVLEPGGELENLQDGDQITFTQDAQIIGELLDLIISQGRAVRGLPAEGSE